MAKYIKTRSHECFWRYFTAGYLTIHKDLGLIPKQYSSYHLGSVNTKLYLHLMILRKYTIHFLIIIKIYFLLLFRAFFIIFKEILHCKVKKNSRQNVQKFKKVFPIPSCNNSTFLPGGIMKRQICEMIDFKRKMNSKQRENLR